MKFYDVEMEEALLTLARNGLEQTGGCFQRKDRRLWLRFILWQESLFAANSQATWRTLLLTWVLLAKTTIAGWQILIPGILMTISVRTLHRKFKMLSLHSPTADTLRHLPVRGPRILLWAREQVLRHAFFLLVWAMAGAWCMAGFPLTFTGAVSWLAHGLLMLGMCLVTVILLMHPWLVRLRLSFAWSWIIMATFLIEVWMLFTVDQHGKVPAWAVQWSDIASSLLPPLWVHPNRLLGWGGVLAFLWCLWGSWYWWRWPALAGQVFEAPIDWPEEQSNKESEDVKMDEQPPVNTVASLRGIEPKAEGWIERLAWRCLNAPDRPVAAAFVKHPLRWSSSWHCAMAVCLLALGILWLSRELPWLKNWQESITPWCLLLPILALTSCWPVSNMIPRATSMWEQGNLQQPFYAGLPVSARDLLRISTRLTLVRCALFILLIIPILILAAWLFLGQIPQQISVVSAALFVLAVLWVLSRPAFVAWRLLGRIKEAHGTLWGQLGLLSILLIIGLSWATACWFLAVHALNWGEAPYYWSCWAAIFFGLCFHGLCARAFFEVFHWRLRTGKVDLIRPV